MNETSDETTTLAVPLDVRISENDDEMTILEPQRAAEMDADELVKGTSGEEFSPNVDGVLVPKTMDHCVETDGCDEEMESMALPFDTLPPFEGTVDMLEAIETEGAFSDISGLSPIRRRSIDDDIAVSLQRASIMIPTQLGADENVLQYFQNESTPDATSAADEDFLPTYQPRFSLLFTTIDEDDEECDSDDQDQDFESQNCAVGTLSPPPLNKLATLQEGSEVEASVHDEWGQVAVHRQFPVDHVDDASSSFQSDDTELYVEDVSISKADNTLPTSEELGASSMAFIQHLRGAAFRRKMNLSRSRDSLAAKERKHLEDVAASERDASQDGLFDLFGASETRRRSLSPSHTSHDAFKARPLPHTNGILGNGGMVGVPKVDKRPTTTPISPKLGLRRHLDNGVGEQKQTSPPSKQADFFTARSLPKTNGAHGGMVGVPKVEKRPVTTPISPCLGPRRVLRNGSDPTERSSVLPSTNANSNDAHGGLVGVPKVEKRPTTVPVSPCLGPRRQLRPIQENDDASAVLGPRESRFQPTLVFKALPLPRTIRKLGESGVPKIPRRQATIPQSPLLGSRRPKTESTLVPETRRRLSLPSISLLRSKASNRFDSESRKENEEADMLRNIGNQFEFIPHSTERAVKRAEFEAQREVLERQRKEDERKDREQRILGLRNKLCKLRMSI